jgi:hypothetical protein
MTDNFFLGLDDTVFVYALLFFYMPVLQRPGVVVVIVLELWTTRFLPRYCYILNARTIYR